MDTVMDSLVVDRCENESELAVGKTSYSAVRGNLDRSPVTTLCRFHCGVAELRALPSAPQCYDASRVIAEHLSFSVISVTQNCQPCNTAPHTATLLWLSSIFVTRRIGMHSAVTLGACQSLSNDKVHHQ